MAVEWGLLGTRRAVNRANSQKRDLAAAALRRAVGAGA
jgi:hypothetical protein